MSDDWQVHAARLAEELTAAGKLHSPEWRAAVRAVPRHLLVPASYHRDGDGWVQRSNLHPMRWPVVLQHRPVHRDGRDRHARRRASPA